MASLGMNKGLWNHWGEGEGEEILNITTEKVTCSCNKKRYTRT